MFDLIITGLGEILGFELIIALLLMFSFILMIISRGAGITSIIGTLFLTVYLFSNEKMGGYYLLGNEWFVTVSLLVGLLIGFMLYMVFWR